jgi:hypothetical protein
MAQRYFLKYKHQCIQKLFVDNGYFLCYFTVLWQYMFIFSSICWGPLDSDWRLMTGCPGTVVEKLRL